MVGKRWFLLAAGASALLFGCLSGGDLDDTQVDPTERPNGPSVVNPPNQGPTGTVVVTAGSPASRAGDPVVLPVGPNHMRVILNRITTIEDEELGTITVGEVIGIQDGPFPGTATFPGVSAGPGYQVEVITDYTGYAGIPHYLLHYGATEFSVSAGGTTPVTVLVSYINRQITLNLPSSVQSNQVFGVTASRPSILRPEFRLKHLHAALDPFVLPLSSAGGAATSPVVVTAPNETIAGPETNGGWKYFFQGQFTLADAYLNGDPADSWTTFYPHPDFDQEVNTLLYPPGSIGVGTVGIDTDGDGCPDADDPALLDPAISSPCP